MITILTKHLFVQFLPERGLQKQPAKVRPDSSACNILKPVIKSRLACSTGTSQLEMELKDELKLHALTAGELVFMYLLGTQSSGIEGLPSSFYIAVLACRSWLTCMSHSI